MRIGILTFHRAHNYGAVLQCYALQRYLASLGYDVRVIDYNRKELWAYYTWRLSWAERYALQPSLKLPIRLLGYLWSRTRPLVRYCKFVWFQQHVLRLSPVSSIKSHPYDLILIGSDQVWNTVITQGFDPYYWGAFERPQQTKVATYAASLKETWNECDYERVHEYFKCLDGISVRELAVKDMLLQLFPDIKAVHVPDPVLLLTATEWKHLAKKPRINTPYVFFYQAHRLERVCTVAQRIAEQKRLPLVTLSADVNAENTACCHSASPQEFLGWILHADLVVTSSFHALAFSIIFEKKFYAINLNLGQDERLKDLVRKVGLEDRLIDDESQAHELKDFQSEELLKRMRLRAEAYINSL